MSVEIRKAIPEDATGIADLATALGYPSSPKDVSQRLSDTLRRDDHFVAVAVDGSQGTVGWIHACEEIRIESGLKVEIGGLIVRDDARGKGIGQRLLEAAECWAAERGTTRIWLRSNIVRARAHAFFRKAGYNNSKTSYVFDKTLAS